MHVREQHTAYYSTTNKAKCVYFVIFYHRERIEHDYTHIFRITMSEEIRQYAQYFKFTKKQLTSTYFLHRM